VLIDPASGRPDGNAVTTMRTGAAGGLGLRQLARPDSSSVCLSGTGVQTKCNSSARDDITVFDMTGLALQGLSVARMLLDRACQSNLGTTLSWPW
jgi:ornithine cyclodeaminase/alanine dehydrogenase-like protein (mu-crystallin family)